MKNKRVLLAISILTSLSIVEYFLISFNVLELNILLWSTISRITFTCGILINMWLASFPLVFNEEES